MYGIQYLDHWMQFVEQNTEFFWDKLERTSYARIRYFYHSFFVVILLNKVLQLSKILFCPAYNLS